MVALCVSNSHGSCMMLITAYNCLNAINPIALRKAKIVYNFGLSEVSRVNQNTEIKIKLNDVPNT